MARRHGDALNGNSTMPNWLDTTCKSSLCSGIAKLKPATHVKVRHILCEKHSKALEALDKVKGGEQFATVRASATLPPAGYQWSWCQAMARRKTGL